MVVLPTNALLERAVEHKNEPWVETFDEIGTEDARGPICVCLKCGSMGTGTLPPIIMGTEEFSVGSVGNVHSGQVVEFPFGAVSR